MKKHIVHLLLLCSFFSITANNAQPEKKKPINYDFYGYVKYEAIGDTRQVVGTLDDQISLFPSFKLTDTTNCCDINSQGQLDMFAIESRSGVNIFGPKVLGAKASAHLEGDFTAVNSNHFRMRHSFLKLGWKHVTFTAGQTWNPMYVTACAPGTVSFNTGTPFDSFARDPQVRLTYHLGESVDIITAAATQRGFKSDGPDGQNTKYNRNAPVPKLHVQLQAHINEYIFGVGVDYKQIRPRLQTNHGFCENEKLGSIAAIGYAAFNWNDIVIKTKLLFNQNSTDYLMLGGYAVKCRNTDTDEREYTNLNNIAWWLDIYRPKKVEPGLFIGYTKNIGASSDKIIPTLTENDGSITPLVYGFSLQNTDQYVGDAVRVSPRIRWNLEPVTFAAELEIMHVTYGTLNEFAKLDNKKSTNNVRVLLAAYYFF